MLPRERLIEFGPNYLSFEELLALIIGSGYKDLDVFHLARKLTLDYTIEELLNLRYEEIIRIKGLKKAKATRIIASLELAKRIFAYIPKNLVLKDPDKIYNYLKSAYVGKTKEEFIVLFLDERVHLIKKETISTGDKEMVSIDIQALFKMAIKLDAKGIIMVHNHPSGDVRPSLNDKITTKEIFRYGKNIGIQLLDHMIIGNDKYYSFMLEEELK